VVSATPFPQKKEIKVILGGDVMMGRSVMIKAFERKDQYYPFLKVGDYLKSADLTFVNLEAPFVDGCLKTNTGMVFCVDPSLAHGLNYSGIDVVSLANNHIDNYSQAGVEKTKKVLDEAGILWTGLNNLVIKEVDGVKFGFLGFNFIYRTPTQKELDLVEESDALVDVLIVGTHWGEEYKSLANSFQTSVAKQLIHLGADVIVGHHPHWVQNWEYVEGRPVFYSLGNLVFDQMWSEETKKGAIIELTYNQRELKDVKKTDIYIREVGQPELVN